jgi:hypothetical protein
MKRKLLLGLVAVLMTAALAAGGTLMLFSHQTASATNSIHLSSGIKAVLLESDGTVENSELVYKKVVSNVSDTATETSGIQFGVVQPAAKLEKRPKVSREIIDGATGYVNEDPDTAADAYVAVRADIVTNIGDGTGDVNLSDIKIDGVAATEQNVADLISGMKIADKDGDPGINSGWVFVRDAATNNPLEIGGWFFYVIESGETGAGNLKVLSTDAETGDIFTYVKFNDFKGADAELFALLGAAGLEIKLELTAYLVQADHNPYNEDTADKTNYKAAFSGTFTSHFS